MIGKSYLYIYKGKIFFVITNESKTSYWHGNIIT
jgi:hypothetical protein